MKATSSTTVIERLIDLELVFKLKADLLKYKKGLAAKDKKQHNHKAA
jgi:hypothetical protein